MNSLETDVRDGRLLENPKKFQKTNSLGTYVRDGRVSKMDTIGQADAYAKILSTLTGSEILTECGNSFRFGGEVWRVPGPPCRIREYAGGSHLPLRETFS